MLLKLLMHSKGLFISAVTFLIVSVEWSEVKFISVCLQHLHHLNVRIYQSVYMDSIGWSCVTKSERWTSLSRSLPLRSCHAGMVVPLKVRGVARIMEKCRHRLFRRGAWGWSKGSMGQSPRKPTGYTTERTDVLIILEALLTTWNSDYFVPFWQYHYGLTKTLTSLTTQIDLSRPDGWSRDGMPFETLMPKGITKYMSDRGYSLNVYKFVMNYSLFFTWISLWNVFKNHIQVDLHMSVYISWTAVHRQWSTLSRISRVSLHWNISRLLSMTPALSVITDDAVYSWV